MPRNYRLVPAEAMVSTDSRGIVTYYNESAQALFGYRPGEVIGKPASDFLRGGTRDLRRIGVSLWDEDAVAELRIEVIGKHQQTIAVELSAIPIYAESSRLAGAVAVCREWKDGVSPRHPGSVQDRLMEAILGSFGEVAIVLDAEQKIASWDKGAEALFGYTAQEMVGSPLDRLIAGEARLQPRAAEAGQTGALQDGASTFQTRLRAKNGRVVDVTLYLIEEEE